MAHHRPPSMPTLTHPASPTPHTYFTQDEAASERALRASVPRRLFHSPTSTPLVRTTASPPRSHPRQQSFHPRQQSFHPSATTQSARSLSVKHQPCSTTSTRYLADDHTATPAPVAETIRRPIMYRGRYGAPGTWHLDPFTLPHNAIRAECVDLYNILESIHARSHPVEPLELDEFHVWWSTFEIFIIEYFDFEADVLFPWAFAATSAQDNPLSDLDAQKLRTEIVLRNSLLAKKEVLLDAIRQLNGTFELRRNLDTADVFHTILQEVNQFVPRLLEYFHTQERHLPSIVERHYSASSKDVLMRRYLHYIKNGESPHTNLVLLSRWMDPDVKDKWLRANLGGLTRFLHKRWERRCNRTHGHIAYRFHRRLLRSVRSVAASRLRRRTEFGEEVDDISFSSIASKTGSIRSLNLPGQSETPASMRGSRASKDVQKARLRIR